MARFVTLATDFGTADGYVGEMKGVLMTAAPELRVVDITHDLPPQDVESGRLALARYWRRFPVGTVHIVVVDPEVGATRRAIAVESEGRFLVGPDNGVLSPALVAGNAQVVALPVPEAAAPTFHGRDLFAPAAAQLALGTPLATLGSMLAAPVIRRTPEVRRLADGRYLGEVLTVDRFGNLITNLSLRHALTVEIGAVRIPVRRTYADVPEGVLVAVAGSNGLLEIAARGGAAARVLNAARGTPVTGVPG
ncbi:MAG: SAM-dependent chlorinase/fluorinase [Gemmatimonadaceae bacterium]|nr:SAM-dependent chlorinase/fluorinase [Gemmatimonadaceae bacterium]